MNKKALGKNKLILKNEGVYFLAQNLSCLRMYS